MSQSEAIMTKDMTKEVTIELAERVQRIKPSATLSVSTRAEELQAQGKNIINLSVGEPDFDTPEYIKAAGIRAIQEGHNRYTAVDGIKPLRQAVVDKFKHDNHLNYELNQILISCGAKHSLYNAFSALLNPGDEVIIPAPYWVSYPDIVKLCDGEPVIITTDFAKNFKMTPEQLESAITPKTRALIINSPSNPTGLIYSKQDLQALGEVISRHPNLMVISDDIYEHNIFNGSAFVNIVNACPALYDRTIVVNGVSKTYAMTGWRIGYAAGPAKVIAAMKKAQSQSTSNPASASQYAALAALTGDQATVGMMTKAYKERHDYFVGELNKLPGFHCIPSDGTFYTFPSIEGCIKELGLKDDLEFAEFLLNKAEIAVIPGSAFGAPGHIRICYTTSVDNLKAAVARLQKLLIK